LKLEQSVIAYVKENLSSFNEDAGIVDKAVSQSGAIYKGAPVPYLYIPRIFDKADWETFKSATSQMMALSKRVIALYMEKPEIRAYYGFDKRLEELICLPHGYDTVVPMGRFDIFYYGDGHYQFCELNADGASAMNEEKELSEILKNTEAMRSYDFDKMPEPCELFESWVTSVRKIYANYLSKKGKTLEVGATFTVGIVDILEKGSPLEFEVFKKTFEAAGIACHIVDARTLEYVDGKLMAGEHVIDVVYRRLVTKDLMDAYDTLGALITAMKEDAACVIGPIKTQVIHTKRFFEVLYSDVLRPYLSADEIAFIEAHIPFTAPLTEKNLYLQNKDDYIIKPVDYYASKGVCAGRDYNDADWHALLSDKYNGDFVIQRYCPYALVENVALENGKLVVDTFRHITGLFVYDETLVGAYSRAGRNAIISGLHDGFTLSSLFIKE